MYAFVFLLIACRCAGMASVDGRRVPVPGYVTTFSMYKRVEYALPGEVPSVGAGGTPKHDNDTP